jgi:hypothetical protein
MQTDFIAKLVIPLCELHLRGTKQMLVKKNTKKTFITKTSIRGFYIYSDISSAACFLALSSGTSLFAVIVRARATIVCLCSDMLKMAEGRDLRDIKSQI